MAAIAYGITGAEMALAPTAVMTGAYTSAIGDLVLCSTSAGAFTVKLPNAPANGSRVGVKIVATSPASQYVLTVACQGSDVINKAGGSASVGLVLLNQGLIAQYNATAGIWYITTDDLPLSGVKQLIPDWLNVTAFGAVSGTDSTAAIQAALNAPGPVFIPDGTYKVSAILTVGTTPTVAGNGIGTVLFMANGANLRHILDASSTTDCTVRDLVLNGNGTAQASGATSLLGGDSSTRLTARGVRAVNSWGQGIYWGAAIAGLIEGCIATGNGAGAVNGFGFGLNDGATQNRIIGCYTSGNLEGGYSLYGTAATTAAAAYGNTISACTAYNETALGFNIYNGFTNSITGCQAIGCGTAGFQVEYAAYGNTLADCQAISSAGTYGINVIPTGAGNAVEGCSSIGANTGLNIDNVPDIDVIGGQYNGNVNIGVYLGHSNGCSNVNINVTASNNGQAGLQTATTVTGGKIAGQYNGNGASGGNHAGIYLGGAATELSVSATALGNTTYGIKEAGTSNYNLFTGCLARGYGAGDGLVVIGANSVAGSNITA